MMGWGSLLEKVRRGGQIKSESCQNAIVKSWDFARQGVIEGEGECRYLPRSNFSDRPMILIWVRKEVRASRSSRIERNGEIYGFKDLMKKMSALAKTSYTGHWLPPCILGLSLSTALHPYLHCVLQNIFRTLPQKFSCLQTKVEE